MVEILPVFSNVVFSGNGSRLLGQLFLMAPSDGVRRKLREEVGAEGTWVGVRDWRGLRLKLSRWVLTRGLMGVWRGWGCETGGRRRRWGGGEAGRQTNNSSLSERSNERVELQSDTNDKDSSVEEEGKPRSGSEGAEGFSGLSRLNSLRGGGLRLWPPVLWKKPSHLDLILSSGWAKVSKLQPSPAAASRAPQPSRTSSERRDPAGLFLLSGDPGTWLLGQYSSLPPSPAAVFPSLWKGMQR